MEQTDVANKWGEHKGGTYGGGGGQKGMGVTEDVANI